MRAIARFSLIIALTALVFTTVRFGPRLFSSDKTNRTNADRQPGAVRQNSREIIAKTNSSGELQTGFFIGKGDQRVYINYATPDPILRSFIQSVMDGSSDPNAKGKEIFLKLCAACHQNDGAGKEGVAPPLAGSEWALTAEDRLVRIVLNGMTGPVRVLGKTWNLTMPPWRENLTDDQIAVVLSYVRSGLEGNHAGRVATELVSAARKAAPQTPETSDPMLHNSGQ